jgi:hypothetical protein
MTDSARDLPKVRDADSLRQPGFATIRDGTQRDARRALYDQYDAQIASQWQNPPTGIGSRGLAGVRVGGVCTVKAGAGKYGPEGAPGHWTMVDDELICVADDRAADTSTADANAIKDAAYNQYDRDLADAWRRAR